MSIASGKEKEESKRKRRMRPLEILVGHVSAIMVLCNLKLRHFEAQSIL